MFQHATLSLSMHGVENRGILIAVSETIAGSASKIGLLHFHHRHHSETPEEVRVRACVRAVCPPAQVWCTGPSYSVLRVSHGKH